MLTTRMLVFDVEVAARQDTQHSADDLAQHGTRNDLDVRHALEEHVLAGAVRLAVETGDARLDAAYALGSLGMVASASTSVMSI